MLSEIEFVINDLKKIYTLIIVEMPYLFSILKSLRISISNDVKEPVISTETEIIINPNLWKNLSIDVKKFYLLHNAFHVILLHPIRMKYLVDKYPEDIIQIACDCIVNNLLTIPFEIQHQVITFEKLAKIIHENPEFLKKLSMEELVKLLSKKLSKKLSITKDLFTDGKSIRKIIVQESGKELYINENEFEKVMKYKLSQLLVFLKNVDNKPLGLIREIEELLRSKIDWRFKFRELIRDYIFGFSYRTWIRYNRRFPEVYPGTKFLNVGNIICLVDTSGSISTKELEQFASEVFTIAQTFNIDVITYFWDVDFYGPFKLKSTIEFLNKWNNYCRGGGGTVIENVIKEVFKKVKPIDIIVIFTDGEIFDIEKPEIQDILKKLVNKCSGVVFVSTYKIPKLPRGIDVIKI